MCHHQGWNQGRQMLPITIWFSDILVLWGACVHDGNKSRRLKGMVSFLRQRRWHHDKTNSFHCTGGNGLDASIYIVFCQESKLFRRFFSFCIINKRIRQRLSYHSAFCDHESFRFWSKRMSIKINQTLSGTSHLSRISPSSTKSALALWEKEAVKLSSMCHILYQNGQLGYQLMWSQRMRHFDTI